MKTRRLFIFLFIFSFFLPLASYSDSITSIPKEISLKIEKEFPGDKVATKEDFGSYFDKSLSYLFETVIVYDLTGDSVNDFVLLLINKEKMYFQFVIYSSDNSFSKSTILSKSNWPKEHDNTIWQVMWLKKEGDYGMASEKYFNAPGKEYPYFKGNYTDKDVSEYKLAVEKYRKLPVIEKSDATYGWFDSEDIFYYKSSYYYEDGHFKHLKKYD